MFELVQDPLSHQVRPLAAMTLAARRSTPVGGDLRTSDRLDARQRWPRPSSSEERRAKRNDSQGRDPLARAHEVVQHATEVDDPQSSPERLSRPATGAL